MFSHLSLHETFNFTYFWPALACFFFWWKGGYAFVSCPSWTERTAKWGVTEVWKGFVCMVDCGSLWKKGSERVFTSLSNGLSVDNRWIDSSMPSMIRRERPRARATTAKPEPMSPRIGPQPPHFLLILIENASPRKRTFLGPPSHTVKLAATEPVPAINAANCEAEYVSRSYELWIAVGRISPNGANTSCKTMTRTVRGRPRYSRKYSAYLSRRISDSPPAEVT